MQIYGPTHVHGAQGISAPHAPRQTPAQPTARPASSGDEVTISDAARIASQLSEVPDVRQDRVAAIRTAIQDGTYETAEKLSGAVDRLLDEIG